MQPFCSSPECQKPDFPWKSKENRELGISETLFPLDFMSLFSCVFYRQKDEFRPFIPRIFTFSLRLFNFWSHFVATTFQDTGHFSQ